MLNKGRKRIYASYEPDELDAVTVARILADAVPVHLNNAEDIDYLHNYTKGMQPVLNREKDVRPEINNKIVENHAYEIVEFKTGYCFGSPVTYVSRANPEDKGGLSDSKPQETSYTNNANEQQKQPSKPRRRKSEDKVNRLNTLCLNDDKPNTDRELADWIFECGIGFKATFPLSASAMRRKEKSAPPFHTSVLDPRNTFCVYSTNMEHSKLLSCSYYRKHGVGLTDTVEIIAYTDDFIYTASLPYSMPVADGSDEATSWMDIVVNGTTQFEVTPNPMGINPIVEYDGNTSRLGSFEPVIELLDALNETASNRVDGVEQFVQSFIKFINCDIDEESFTAMKQLGAIKVSSNGQYTADVDIITSELNQDQTQTLVEDMYNKVLAIAGVPDRRASAGGNTGQALIIGQGWTNAESRALSFEKMFSKSERETILVTLKILQSYPAFKVTGLETADIDIKFTRNRTDNLLNKSQVLLNLLQAGVHPLGAISISDITSDPENLFNMSEDFMIPKWKVNEQPAQLQQANQNPDDKPTGTDDMTNEPQDADSAKNAERNIKANDTTTSGDNNAESDAINKAKSE